MVAAVVAPVTPAATKGVAPAAVAIAEAIKKAYDLGPEERKRRGKLGREWVLSDEAQMTGQGMSNNVIEAFEETFVKFKKRSRFDLIKVKDRKKDYITHKLIY